MSTFPFVFHNDVKGVIVEGVVGKNNLFLEFCFSNEEVLGEIIQASVCPGRLLCFDCSFQ